MVQRSFNSKWLYLYYRKDEPTYAWELPKHHVSVGIGQWFLLGFDFDLRIGRSWK